MQPWMRYRAKEQLGTVGLAAHFLRAEDRRLQKLRSVKSVLSSTSLNKLHPAAEKCLKQMEHLKKMESRLLYNDEPHESKPQPENSQHQHQAHHSAAKQSGLHENQAPPRRRRRLPPPDQHHSGLSIDPKRPARYTMYKQAPKDDDYDYIVGLDAKQAPTRSRQEAEEGNVLPSLPSERQKKKKKLIRKRRKQTSDENVGDDILNSADELLNKEEMSQVSAIDLLLKQKMTVNEGESDPAKEQIQKPKRRIKQRSENKEAKSCGDAPTFEGKFRKKSIPPNDKEAATIQPRPRVSHPKVVLPAVVERKTLVAGGCPRCSAEENCSKHTSLTRIQRKSIPKDLKKAQKQGEDSPPPKNTNSRENPTKIENHEHQKPEDLEYVRSLVEEVRRLDPEERTKVLQAVRGGSEDFLLKEDNKHARKVTKDSISSEEVLSGSEDGEQGRKGRIYLHDGSYVSTTQSKDSPQTPTLQTVEQEDKDLCEDEANYSDEDFLAEPQEEERVNLATDHYHSDFED